MRADSLWRGVLGVEKTIIEDVEFNEDEGQIVASVRPVARQRSKCGRCLRRCRGYDQGRGERRRWRALDLGAITTWLEAESPRVQCPEHGVVVAHVPWARHGAGHTHAFDQQVAWLATRTSKSAVVELMRVAWRTVGSIITRVWA
ncbi:MAG: helix-turn-helix domain-containing protein, partial [Mycobacteriales bacterium]